MAFLFPKKSLQNNMDTPSRSRRLSRVDNGSQQCWHSPSVSNVSCSCKWEYVDIKNALCCSDQIHVPKDLCQRLFVTVQDHHFSRDLVHLCLARKGVNTLIWTQLNKAGVKVVLLPQFVVVDVAEGFGECWIITSLHHYMTVGPSQGSLMTDLEWWGLVGGLYLSIRK